MLHAKELFAGLIEIIKDPVWVKSLEGVYLHVNSAFADFVDLPIEGIIGKTDMELLPYMAAVNSMESDAEAMSTGREVVSSQEITDTAGSMISFRTCKIAVTVDDATEAYTVGVAVNTLKEVEAEKEIVALKKQIEDHDTILGAVMDLRTREQKKNESRIVETLTGSVLPYLKKLEQGHLDSVQALLLDAVIENVNSLTVSHSPEMTNILLNLTPTEMQIVELVRKGMTGKEIADHLNLSLATISTHRRNIRRRLGLNNKKINLRQFLLSQ